MTNDRSECARANNIQKVYLSWCTIKCGESCLVTKMRFSGLVPNAALSLCNPFFYIIPHRLLCRSPP